MSVADITDCATSPGVRILQSSVDELHRIFHNGTLALMRCVRIIQYANKPKTIEVRKSILYNFFCQQYETIFVLLISQSEGGGEVVFGDEPYYP